jgi:MFS family permease
MATLSKLALTLPFYYGWVIVVAAGIILFFTYGVQYSIGIFLAAIEQDLHWSRAELSFGYSIYALIYCVMSIISGRLTDKFGPNRVILVGGIFLALGLGLSSQISLIWQFYLSFGLLAGIGMSTVYVPCTTTIVRWFTKRRGMALSLTTLGSSIGILIIPNIVGTILVLYGWRTGYIIIACTLFIIVFCASRFLYRAPKDIGLNESLISTYEQPESKSLNLAQAIRMGKFWHFTSAIVIAKSIGLIPFVHLPSMIILDQGDTIARGAFASSLIGGGAIFGVLIVGALSDRYGRHFAAVLMVIGQTVAFAGWLFTPSLVHYFAFIFGSTYGASLVLMPAITSDLFGRVHVGAIFGVIFAGVGLASSLGTFGAGIAHDMLGNYELVFQVGLAGSLVSLVLFSFLKIPKTNQVN